MIFVSFFLNIFLISLISLLHIRAETFHNKI